MIHDPFGRPEGVGYRQPAAVTGGDDLDEAAEDLECLPVCAPFFRLAEGFEEHLDRFVVSPVGGTGEVQRRFAETPGDEEGPADLPVEREPGGRAELLVDRFGDDRMGNFVRHRVATLVLVDEPSAVGEVPE